VARMREVTPEPLRQAGLVQEKAGSLIGASMARRNG